MNLLRCGRNGGLSGVRGWSEGAVGEGRSALSTYWLPVKTTAIQGASQKRVESTLDGKRCCSPVQPGVQSPSYIYACSNETVYGNEIHSLPRNLPAPLVIDARRTSCQRPMDVSACGLIYAGAQRTSARPASPSSCATTCSTARRRIFRRCSITNTYGQPPVVQSAGIRNLCVTGC